MDVEPQAEAVQAEPEVTAPPVAEPEPAVAAQSDPSTADDPQPLVDVEPAAIAAFSTVDDPVPAVSAGAAGGAELLELVTEVGPLLELEPVAATTGLDGPVLELVTEPVAPGPAWDAAQLLASVASTGAALELMNPTGTTQENMRAGGRALRVARLERFLHQVQSRRVHLAHGTVA
jgi:hypothetical protein